MADKQVYSEHPVCSEKGGKKGEGRREKGEAAPGRQKWEETGEGVANSQSELIQTLHAVIQEATI